MKCLLTIGHASYVIEVGAAVDVKNSLDRAVLVDRNWAEGDQIKKEPLEFDQIRIEYVDRCKAVRPAEVVPAPIEPSATATKAMLEDDDIPF